MWSKNSLFSQVSKRRVSHNLPSMIISSPPDMEQRIVSISQHLERTVLSVFADSSTFPNIYGLDFKRSWRQNHSSNRNDHLIVFPAAFPHSSVPPIIHRVSSVETISWQSSARFSTANNISKHSWNEVIGEKSMNSCVRVFRLQAASIRIHGRVYH